MMTKIGLFFKDSFLQQRNLCAIPHCPARKAEDPFEFPGARCLLRVHIKLARLRSITLFAASSCGGALPKLLVHHRLPFGVTNRCNTGIQHESAIS